MCVMSTHHITLPNRKYSDIKAACSLIAFALPAQLPLPSAIALAAARFRLLPLATFIVRQIGLTTALFPAGAAIMCRLIVLC